MARSRASTPPHLRVARRSGAALASPPRRPSARACSEPALLRRCLVRRARRLAVCRWLPLHDGLNLRAGPLSTRQDVSRCTASACAWSASVLTSSSSAPLLAAGATRSFYSASSPGSSSCTRFSGVKERACCPWRSWWLCVIAAGRRPASSSATTGLRLTAALPAMARRVEYIRLQGGDGGAWQPARRRQRCRAVMRQRQCPGCPGARARPAAEASAGGEATAARSWHAERVHGRVFESRHWPASAAIAFARTPVSFSSAFHPHFLRWRCSPAGRCRGTLFLARVPCSPRRAALLRRLWWCPLVCHASLWRSSDAGGPSGHLRPRKANGGADPGRGGFSLFCCS